MRRENPVIVIGNGIVAKTLVLALGMMNIPHIWGVCDSTKPTKSTKDPRSYALSPSSVKMLSLLEINFKNSVKVDNIELAIGEIFDKPALSIAKNVVPLFHMVDHVDLEAALDEALSRRGQNAEHIAANAISFSQYELELGGENIPYSLLVSAEGKSANIAQAMGIARRVTDYQQSAIVGKIEVEYPHHAVASQIFTPFGPLGLLPGQPEEYSFVWSQATPRADALLNVSEARFVEEMTRLVGGVTGAIRLTTPRGSFPLRKECASRMIDERFVAIGDAAHVVHPLAGQGLNLGLRDVATLVELLVGARRTGQELGNSVLLETYQTARDKDISRIEAVTDAIHFAAVKGGDATRLALAFAFKAGERFKILDLLLGDFAIDMPEDAPSLLRGVRP